jgi:hypothetical protein
MTRKTRSGTTLVEVEFQNYVMHKVDELINNGDFPDVASLVNCAVMYSLGRGELRFINEYLAERMNDELIQNL